MRTSSYNIYVKIDINQDYYFIANSRTGAFDLLNVEITKILKKNKTEEFSNINEQTLNSLLKRGYITKYTEKEERNHVKTIADYIAEKKRISCSFVMMVTYNCNFRCPYCYENKISNSGAQWTRKTLTKKLVDRAYQSMIEIEPDRTKHGNIIGLYGGEPLLSNNYQIVKYVIEEGKKRDYMFRAVTNGYDLDAYKDLLKKDIIGALQITIDGLENSHNSRRIHYKYKDSFSKILKNIEMCIEQEIMLNIRVNIDQTNYKEIKELLKLFEHNEWSSSPNFYVSLAQTFNEKCSEFKSGMSRKEYLNEVIKLKSKDLGSTSIVIQDDNLEQFIKSSIYDKKLFIPKSVYCGAHTGMYVFDPNGDIYTCWDKVGKEQYIIGGYEDNLKINKESADKWRNRIVTNIPKCSKCRYSLFCSGGCVGILDTEKNLDLNIPNCSDFPFLFSKIINYLYAKDGFNILN